MSNIRVQYTLAEALFLFAPQFHSLTLRPVPLVLVLAKIAAHGGR